MEAQTLTGHQDKARLGDIANRSEKGTALGLIRAQTKARNEKTARLKALRLQREAEEGVPSEIEATRAPRKAAAPSAKKPARKPRARKAA